ncbi:hypothetical protein AB9P05_22190 [Roseivirga sp. BDSF3-8]|uniref:hypothetical protein n=1 Tax=Roseivirga sp. BDSF3-8 TaxID=3241598 RepID=UPI0035325232
MRKLLLSFFLILSAYPLLAQGEIEKRLDGIKIKKHVYLNFSPEENKIRYKINLGNEDVYEELSDSSLFLFTGQGSTLVFATPLNPLVYNVKTKSEIRDDKLISDLNNALSKLTQQSSLEVGGTITKGDNTKERIPLANKYFKNIFGECIDLTEDEILKIKTLDSLVYTPVFSKKIINAKKELSSLDFTNKPSEKLNAIKSSIKDVHKEQVIIDSLYEQAKKILMPKIKACTNDDKSFMIAMLFTTYFHNTYLIIDEREKAISVLKEMEKTVSEYAGKLENINGHSFERIAELTLKRGKVHDINYEVTYKEDGEDKKVSKTMTFTHYRGLLWEVTPGVAFTNVIYDTYGISTDADGASTVAEAGKEHIKQVNVNVMLNANFVIPSWHETMPFVQIGAGPSKDYPMLFTGIGLRINDRFRISTGAVFTWVKELNELQVGDPVDGTAALEKDLSYTFTGPKFYLGLQMGLK